MINIASAWYDTFAGTADCVVVAEYDKMTDFIQNSAVETFTIWDDVIKTTQAFKFLLSGDNSIIYGGATASSDLHFYACSGTYPRIQMEGAGDIILDSARDIVIKEQNVQFAQMSLENSGGQLFLHECTTPTAKADYMTLYTKADNKIYCQTGDGVEHEMAFA